MPVRCRARGGFSFPSTWRKTTYRFGVCAPNWAIFAACGLWHRESCDESMSKTAPTSTPSSGVSPPVYPLPPACIGYWLRFVLVNPVWCPFQPVQGPSPTEPPVLCPRLRCSETSPFVPVVQQGHALTFWLFLLSTGAAIAGVYRAAGKKMIPFEALILGVGQTFCVVVVSFLRILATL